jgi:SAM-dependent methyltransferase
MRRRSCVVRNEMTKSKQGHSPDALRWATEAHYVDADRYDRTYKMRKHDVAFYEEVAEEYGSPVLELGIGTGRVALALARKGHRVVGVELMDTMLSRLKTRLAKEPEEVRARIETKRGDMRRFDVKEAFPLVIAPFNALMHLYTREDFEKMLAQVKAHLTKKGVFIFDVRMPDIRSFVRHPDKSFRCPPLKDAKDGLVYETGEMFQYEARTQVQMITSTYRQRDDAMNVFIKPLAHRQYFPQELEQLLHYNGFVLTEMWGDFERGVVHVDCESQVCVARLRTGR